MRTRSLAMSAMIVKALAITAILFGAMMHNL